MKNLKQHNFNEDVNVSKTHPLKETAWLLTGIFAIILALYVGSGLAIHIIAENISRETEDKILSVVDFDEDMYGKQSEHPENRKIQKRLQEIVDEVTTKKDLGKYKLYVVEDSVPNAFAAPVRKILITTALIDELESENAITYVLMHEIAHHENHDILKGLGRGLVLTTASIMFLGDDITGSVVGGFSGAMQNKFSRDQESAADAFALDLLNEHYGHVGGATELFNMKLHSHGKVDEFMNSKYFEYLSTHPVDSTRIGSISKWSKEKGYISKPVTKHGFEPVTSDIDFEFSF